MFNIWLAKLATDQMEVYMYCVTPVLDGLAILLNTSMSALRSQLNTTQH